MYMIMRAVQILALVVFLWGSANDNAQNLVGNGAPILVWGSFAVMIIAAYLGAKERQKSGAVGGFLAAWNFNLLRGDWYDRIKVILDHSYQPEGKGWQQTRGMLALG